MTRRTLPQRRAAETFDLRSSAAMSRSRFTAGFYDDGTLGEVFITTPTRAAQDLQNIANDAAVILSLALQHHTSASRSSGTQ